jgi:hypothetical protein
MMFDRRIAMGLLASVFGIGLAMPVKAQQVVLTPAGSAFSTVMTPQSDGMSEISKPAPPPTEIEIEIGERMRRITAGLPFTEPPGTGQEVFAPLRPGADNSIDIGIDLPSLPTSDDVVIGGVRYGDLKKLDKSEPFPRQLTEEELRDVAFFTTTTQNLSTSNAVVANVGSVATSTNVPATRNSSIAAPAPGNITATQKNLNQNLVLFIPQTNDSPLSTSRILPMLTR